MDRSLKNRQEAGELLATKLTCYKYKQDILILALPRGGVPVAYEISTSLSLPMDILIVRKIGMPSHEEFAIGALTINDIVIINPENKYLIDFEQDAIQNIIKKEKEELQRRNKLYRQDKPLPTITNKKILLVDDGIATGATMRAAISALKQLKAQKIIIVTPILPVETLNELKNLVDDIVYLFTPEPFYAVGAWYKDFPQVTDTEVINLLNKMNTTFSRKKS